MYTIPAKQENKIYTIDHFLGVDFSSSPIEVDKRRSPNAVNLINNHGFNETRQGYYSIYKFQGAINGVWNIDTKKGELFLVHAGDSLYECTTDFNTQVKLLDGIANKRSTGIYFNEYLLIFNGERIVVYGTFDGNYQAKFLDTCGYIPTTSIARDSSGGGTDYEPINMLSPYRINTFLPEKIKVETNNKDENGATIWEEYDQKEFIVDDVNIDEITLVEVLNDQAEWISKTEFTFDLTTGTVTFNTAPGESPVLGRDSIRIRYKKSVADNAEKINKCDIATLYGYEGNNNRIFVSGNPDFPNYDWHCEQDNAFFWSDESFTKIGTEPVINYSRLNDGTLAIQKKQSDTDCTVYYRSYNLMNEIEVFPLADGVKNIGCISHYANANLLNDPLTLTNQGIFALVSSGTNNEKFAMERSYYINKKLLKEPNLENAIAIVVDGKYYLSVNNHMYIADYRYKSYPHSAKTEQYQYEWWYWDNIPARVLFSWNNKLYFGTSDGNICSFYEEYKDYENPISCYWETPFLELNSSNLTKSIKRITTILNSIEPCDITIGYLLNDDTSEIVTRSYSISSNNFPKIIQEKEKIKKFMYIKFFFKNNTQNKMTFENLILEYTNSGKYRGD